MNLIKKYVQINKLISRIIKLVNPLPRELKVLLSFRKLFCEKKPFEFLDVFSFVFENEDVVFVLESIKIMIKTCIDKYKNT